MVHPGNAFVGDLDQFYLVLRDHGDDALGTGIRQPLDTGHRTFVIDHLAKWGTQACALQREVARLDQPAAICGIALFIDTLALLSVMVLG